MPSRYPFHWLIALSLLFFLTLLIVSMWLSQDPWSSWLKDFSLELAVLSLGIPITVLIVDKVLERHDEGRWSDVDRIGRGRIAILAREVILSFQRALEVPDLFDPTNRRWESDDELEAEFDKFLINFARNNLCDAVEGVSRIPSDRLDCFVTELTEHAATADQIILLFRNRMSPDFQTRILTFQDMLSTAASTLPLVSAPQPRISQVSGAFEMQDKKRQYGNTFADLMASSEKSLINYAADLLESSMDALHSGIRRN